MMTMDSPRLMLLYPATAAPSFGLYVSKYTLLGEQQIVLTTCPMLLLWTVSSELLGFWFYFFSLIFSFLGRAVD